MNRAVMIKRIQRKVQNEGNYLVVAKGDIDFAVVVKSGYHIVHSGKLLDVARLTDTT